jgi:hypothetical protein
MEGAYLITADYRGFAMMKANVTLGAMLMAVLLTGCVTQECATVCIAPVTPFQPQSGTELLARLNSRMPFPIEQGDVYCSWGDDGMVAWVIVDDSIRKNTLTRTVRQSADFRVLSVGYFAPQDRDMFARDQEVN